MTRTNCSAPLRAINAHVGAQLKAARQSLGLSQADVGQKVGVTYQQIAKYESGGNRVSAGMLWRLADVLGVTVSSFYEGIGSAPAGPDDNRGRDRQLLDLVRNFSAIRDPAIRNHIAALLRHLADAGEQAPARAAE